MNGMPQCRHHCEYAFSTWHAFYYHVNSRSCSTLRQLLDQSVCPEQIMRLSEAIVENEEILEFAKGCSWKALGLHTLSRVSSMACPFAIREATHAVSSSVSSTEQLIVTSKLSLQKPCQFCGQTYQRRDAHLRTCVGIFQGFYLYLRVARGRPLQELDDGSLDCHGGRATQAQLERGHQGASIAEKPGTSGGDRLCSDGAIELVRKSDDVQCRFPGHKPDNKGPAGKGQPGKGRGKGPNKGPRTGQRGRAKGSEHSWKGQDKWGQRSKLDEWTEEAEEEMEEQGDLRTILRHESQHCTNRLDTGFVIFLQTDSRNSVAVSTYKMAQQWHAVKNQTPDKLEAPMRTCAPPCSSIYLSR